MHTVMNADHVIFFMHNSDQALEYFSKVVSIAITIDNIKWQDFKVQQKYILPHNAFQSFGQVHMARTWKELK